MEETNIDLTKKYHGMSIDEIKSKFYVYTTGTENGAQLKLINSRLSELWQDAGYYYMDTKRQIDQYKTKLRNIEDTLELKEQKVKWKYICDNKVLPTKERYSDPARETAAFIETRDEQLISNLRTIKSFIDDLNEELGIWNEIKENLRFISFSTQDSTRNNVNETRFLKNEPSNIYINENIRKMNQQKQPPAEPEKDFLEQ